MAKASRNPRDPCVVATGPLADLLNGFVSDWRRDRPATEGQFGHREEVNPLKPTTWLADETKRMDTRRRGVKARTIENIMYARSAHVEYRVADMLVAAIGRPEAFYDGTLETLPNPRATRSAQGECCSGSLTGAARTR